MRPFGLEDERGRSRPAPGGRFGLRRGHNDTVVVTSGCFGLLGLFWSRFLSERAVE